MRSAALAGVLALLLLLAGGAAGQPAPPPALTPAPTPEPPPTGRPAHLRPDGHVALAWLYGGSSDDYRAQVERMVGATTLSPTWWYLDQGTPGALEDEADPAFVQWAHDRGLAVWPLLGNRIDPDLTDRVLRDEALRAGLVQQVVDRARALDVDGVNVDFENLYDQTAPLLTQFVGELEAALPDLVVSVDVTAMTDTWVLGNWSTAFDREGLGRVADQVVLMAYDQHNALRRNGPVAGLTWVRESTEFLLRTVPAEKVILGVPFYARDWVDDPSAEQGVAVDATLGMVAMAQRLEERSQAVVYDEVAGQDLHRYVDARGREHRVWQEDGESLARKAALVPAYGLAGVAAWRAGFEDPAAWQAIDDVLRTAPPPGGVSGAAGAVDAAAPPDDVAAEPAAPAPPAPAADGQRATSAVATTGADTGAAGGTTTTATAPAVDAATAADEEPAVDATAAEAPLAAGAAGEGVPAVLDVPPQRPALLLVVAAALVLVVATGLGVTALRPRRAPGR